MGNCSLDYIKKNDIVDADDLKEHYLETGGTLCVQDEEGENVKGIAGSLENQFMDINLRPCDQATLTVGNCMDADELANFYNGKIFKIGLLESKIEYDDIDEPIKTQEIHFFRKAIDLNQAVS